MDTVEFDNLVLGGFPVQTDVATLKSGNNVVRGQVLAKYTGTGDINKLAAYNSAGSNGLSAFYAIAAEDKDASGGDASICFYRAGEFSIDALTFANSDDTADIALRNAAAAVGCYLKETD